MNYPISKWQFVWTIMLVAYCFCFHLSLVAQEISLGGNWQEIIDVSMNGQKPKLNRGFFVDPVEIQFMRVAGLKNANGLHRLMIGDPDDEQSKQYVALFLKTYWHFNSFLHYTETWDLNQFFPEHSYDDPMAIELCRAIVLSDIDRMEELIREGVDINSPGKLTTLSDGTEKFVEYPPLLYAYYLAHDPRPFICLLKFGADPNRMNWNESQVGDYYESVVHYTALGDYNRLFQMVFESGGDPNLRADTRFEKSVTPFLLLNTGLNAPDAVERLELLLEKGAKLDDADSHGRTLLLRYLETADLEYTEQACQLAIKLIEAGANPLVFRQVDKKDFTLGGCYVRPIHRLHQLVQLERDHKIQEIISDLMEKNADDKIAGEIKKIPISQPTGPHAIKLAQLLARYGESFEQAGADLERWQQWKLGGSIPPSTEFPQGLFFFPRVDFQEAIETEHQQWLKLTNHSRKIGDVIPLIKTHSINR